MYPLNGPEAAQRRAAELEDHHSDIDDRLVLAEAEDIGFSPLLSFHADFVKHLGHHTRLCLTTSASFWQSLAVPRGATPQQAPATGNPLGARTWWRW